MGSDKCSKYVKLCTIEVCAPILQFSIETPEHSGNGVHTKGMAMVLDCNTQDFEGVHANSHTLHPLFAL